MAKAVRVLKVHERYRDGEFRSGIYPEIRLAGNWLNRAGFKPGDKVKVEVRSKRLIINKEVV